MSNDTLQVNGVELRYTGDTRTIEGQTASKAYAWGTAYIFDVRLTTKSRLELAEVVWDNGDWDVRCTNADRAPKRFARLCHGLRLGVHRTTDGLNTLELRIARRNGKGWPTACMASMEDLRGRSGPTRSGTFAGWVPSTSAPGISSSTTTVPAVATSARPSKAMSRSCRPQRTSRLV